MDDMINDLLSSYDPADPLNNNCTNGSNWIHHHFKQCVGNPVQYFGFIFGFTAVGLWLAGHIMLLGARHREANPSRREFILILHMCAANVCNLVGATLSEQLGTQVFAAIYLVVTDVVFISHFGYMWYAFRPHPEGGHEFQYSEWQSPDRVREGENGNNSHLAVLVLPWIPSLIYLPGWFKWEPTQFQSTGGTGRNLLMVTDSPTDNFGYTMGFIAAIAYWAVLLPRVMDGLHQKEYIIRRFRIHFFYILANIFYVLSIFMYDKQLPFLLNELPWILGSVGCVILDTAIVYLIVFRENQVARERKAESRLRSVCTIDDEILRHPEDGSQVERTRLDEDSLLERGENGNEVSDAFDSKRLSLILEIDEPEDITMEQKPPRPEMKMVPEYGPSNATGPGVDDNGDASEDGMSDGVDEVDRDNYVFQRVGQTPKKSKFGDDLEWDFADISQTYEYDDDDDVKWHTAKLDAAPVWNDNDCILQELDAELNQDNSSDLESLDFDDETFGGRSEHEIWYEPQTEVVSK